MADLSSYSFTGRLGADAKVSQTPNGKTVMELSVAVNTGYGEFKKTKWIKVRQWGERVNNVAPIFKKGSIVAGTGEPEIDTWTGKDNEINTTFVVTCMSVNLIQGKKDSESEQEGPDSGFNPAEDDAVF